MNRVNLSVEYFANPSIGRALSLADIYVGEVGLDPKIPANQKTISVLQEDGTTVAVAQPITTSAGGCPLYLGSPVTILVEGAYSLRVDDNTGAQVYYVPENGTPMLSESVVESIADLRAVTYTPVDGSVVSVLGYTAATENKDWRFRWTDSNMSTEVLSDPLFGIYVPLTGEDGSGGAWIRLREGNNVVADWWGAGSGGSDDSDAIIAAITYAKEMRESLGVLRVFVEFPSPEYNTVAPIPFVKGVPLIGVGEQGASFYCTGSGAVIYSATYSAGVFTDTLDALVAEVQSGAKEVNNAGLYNIYAEHRGVISGVAGSGASWTGVIDLVGCPDVTIDGVSCNSETDNTNGLSLKHSWRCRVSNYQASRNGANSGGYGLFLDSNCNSAYVDHPAVFGEWDVGILSANPEGVTIIEPNVEFCEVGIQMGGRSPKIYGGEFEGNVTAIKMGTTGGGAATSWLIDNPLIFGSGLSAYGIDLANATTGVCRNAQESGSFLTSFYRPRSKAEGSFGNVIEIFASDAGVPNLAVRGLNTGQNLVKVFGVDYDDHRQYETYQTSSLAPSETRTLNTWGNVWNTFVLDVYNNSANISALNYALDFATVPQFDDMLRTRPAGMTIVPHVSASVGFGTSMCGIFSTAKYILILNTQNQIISEGGGFAVVCFNDTGTHLMVRIHIAARNVLGVSDNRVEIFLYNATTGATVNWDFIPSGTRIRLHVTGFFKPL